MSKPFRSKKSFSCCLVALGLGATACVSGSDGEASQPVETAVVETTLLSESAPAGVEDAAEQDTTTDDVEEAPREEAPREEAPPEEAPPEEDSSESDPSESADSDQAPLDGPPQAFFPVELVPIVDTIELTCDLNANQNVAVSTISFTNTTGGLLDRITFTIGVFDEDWNELGNREVFFVDVEPGQTIGNESVPAGINYEPGSIPRSCNLTDVA